MISDTTPPGALPAYVQISEAIAREIRAGRLLDGERLPSERQMAEDYAVAVGTLRKALGLLENQGLLERRQGSGNYVRHSETAGNVYAFFRLELLGGGGLPKARILSVDRLSKPAHLPSFGTSDEAFRFRRLRSLNDTPAALEEIWLDGSVTNHIAAAQVSESLYHFYTTQLGLMISRAVDTVGVGTTPHWTVDQFGPAPESTTGFIERIAYDAALTPIEVSHTWFDPSVAAYISRLK